MADRENLDEFLAYRDAVADDHPFAMAVRRAMAGRRLVCGRRHAPVRWLWHGGRLLPALVFVAGTLSGRREEAEAFLTTTGSLVYLNHACTGVPDGFEAAASAVVSLLPTKGGSAIAAPIVDLYMESMVKAENDHLGWFLDWSGYQGTRVVFRGLVHDFHEADWELERRTTDASGPRSVVGLRIRRAGLRQCGTDHRRGKPATTSGAAINEISGLRQSAAGGRRHPSDTGRNPSGPKTAYISAYKAAYISRFAY